LFDMLGNANEMCFDLDSGYRKRDGKVLEDAPTVAPVDETHRVMRGGSFDNHPDSLRSGNSGLVFPGVTASTIGFRPVRTYR
jgi:formylglycine-generating enzyme required for sulfatase activity